MPFKFHEPRRHRVPKARYRVTNWPDYDRGLVGRGDLRLWIADDALAAWAAPRRRTRGGQARFSDLAIETVRKRWRIFSCSAAGAMTLGATTFSCCSAAPAAATAAA